MEEAFKAGWESGFHDGIWQDYNDADAQSRWVEFAKERDLNYTTEGGPTDAQVSLLRLFGMKIPDSRKEAATAISKEIERRRKFKKAHREEWNERDHEEYNKFEDDIDDPFWMMDLKDWE